MRHGIKILTVLLLAGCVDSESSDFLGVITAYADGKPMAAEHAIFSTREKCSAATKEQVTQLQSDPDNAKLTFHGYCFSIDRK
jgi:hypothetical protein